MQLRVTARKNEGHVDPTQDTTKQFSITVPDIATPGEQQIAAREAVKAELGSGWRLSSTLG